MKTSIQMNSSRLFFHSHFPITQSDFNIYVVSPFLFVLNPDSWGIEFVLGFCVYKFNLVVVLLSAFRTVTLGRSCLFSHYG